MTQRADSTDPFEQLAETTRQRGLVVSLNPPLGSPPSLAPLGCGWDRGLSELLTARCNGGRIDRFVMLRAGGPGGLIEENLGWRRTRDETPILQQAVMFAGWEALATYFGVVPSLADPEGNQPVVYLDLHDDIVLLPVASCLGRLWALMLECLRRHTTDWDGPFDAIPWEATDVIAADEALVAAMRAGRFDALVRRDDAETAAWFDAVLAGRLMV